MRVQFIFIGLLLQVCLLAQSPKNTYQGSKDSDPKARNILKAVSNKLKLDQGVSFDFTLVTQVAEASAQTQKGKAQIKGQKFNIDLPDQLLVSDGTILWVYLKKRNEIQLQDAATITADPVSPYQLIKIHESPEFVYIWTGESKINNVTCDIIEFKPLDTKAEFFKIKVEIDQAKSAYKKITLFFKSGDQYVLNLNNQINGSLAPTLFTLDPKSYPGAHVEDLR